MRGNGRSSDWDDGGRVGKRVMRVGSCGVLGAFRHAQKTPDLSIPELQSLIRDMYVEKDKERGGAGTFMWLMEEVGELSTALRSGTKKEQEEEFADVLAWLTTIANVVGVDLNKALIDKYGSGCPGCGNLVCL